MTIFEEKLSSMSARLFVGNLPFDVTEAELRELFTPVGPLSYVFLPVDRETGKKRGFAFIEFSDEAKAGEALRRFSDQQFKGRALALSEARARDAARPATPFTPRPRVPRLPEAFDQASAMGEPGPRRERRGRDDVKRNVKAGNRSSRAEGVAKKGPRREREGGRLFGLDADDHDDYQQDVIEQDVVEQDVVEQDVIEQDVIEQDMVEQEEE
jgi:RNA recognition motif-containing protein